MATHNLTDDNAPNNRLTTVVTVHPKPTDIALTGVTGPHSVAQGDTAHVVVTVQNVGEVDVGTPFAVELTDGTAGGAVVGTQTVAGLAIGATTTVDIAWNTAGAAITGHIVIATQKLPDNKSTNDAIAIAINVNAPVPPPSSNDVAVTAVSAPGSVTQGSAATIGVTVQNVGQQNVTGSFDIVLTDQTAGVTIGTQTVAGLAAGASATRSFNWNTTSAAQGGHTLVATQTLSDDNATNNTRSVTVTIAPQPVDLAVTGITAPARVNQGDIAPVVVTVQNVGGQEVTGSFDIVLTDGYNGPTIGTQTVSGLAVDRRGGEQRDRTELRHSREHRFHFGLRPERGRAECRHQLRYRPHRRDGRGDGWNADDPRACGGSQHVAHVQLEYDVRRSGRSHAGGDPHPFRRQRREQPGLSDDHGERSVDRCRRDRRERAWLGD